ncbi:gas vesicle protein GvpJ [Haloprofundus salilacus]|uniref:gas vesicle protein GvpJ n=1 Tax=Haloprofundus salilacus TaxID=2876190 RepID=UPI001CC98FCA|nr:gas vesicle protein [Haloprofundus salilacus]
MSSPGPTRTSDSLADVVEMLLDKGIVINADIVVSVGETELLGIELRAAIASFETAAQYGLQFPEGTDMRRVEAASGREALPEGEDGPLAPIIDASSTDVEAETTKEHEEDDEDTETEADDSSETPEATAESGGGDVDR